MPFPNSRAVQSRFGRQATESLSYLYRLPSLPAAYAADILCSCTKFSVLKRAILLRHTVTRNIAFRFVVEFKGDWRSLEKYSLFTYLCEIKCRIAMAKAAFSRKRALFTGTVDWELRKNLVKCYIWSIALYGAETRTLGAVDQKHLESFEMRCWRRMEKISWTDHVRNEEVLLRVKEQRNILHEISKRKANWIRHILRRNCLLQGVIEGKIKGGIEVTGRRGRRRRKLLDDLKERKGYCHLKEEALDHAMWRGGFGRGFGPVVRQNNE